MNIIHQISKELDIDRWRVTATIDLLDNDSTIPFIARYRKEATGGLDEEQIRNIKTYLDRLRNLQDRKETILVSINSQGKLTDDLRECIEKAETRTELEDLYQPFKPKRKTRATQAKAKGLQPLADLILKQPRILPGNQNTSQLAGKFLNEQVSSTEDAWAGARDIVAEMISDNPMVRQKTRQKGMQWGMIQSEKIDEDLDTLRIYETYYHFKLGLDRIRPHQVLALNRGEREKVLRVSVHIQERDWQGAVLEAYPINDSSPLAFQMEKAIEEAATRLLLPAIDRDIRREISDKAETHAVVVFANNLKNLLTQPPLSGHIIMGIDPGYRTGCKIAIIDSTGKTLNTKTVYPHSPQNAISEAKSTLRSMISEFQVTLIAIGNGTASRETELMVADLIREYKKEQARSRTSTIKGEVNLHYLIVTEAGASVYSASELAREELPEMDVSMRGAVSIARRVQDPLAEFVKIDPRSLGVGMYQHDINQHKLSKALEAVVESAVNFTGVNLNSASSALLTYVSGIGPNLAKKIVSFRDTHGPFSSRQALLDVPGLGPKGFEQCAGFLRIQDAENPLDDTAIHPESYLVAENLLELAGLRPDSSIQAREKALDVLQNEISIEDLATRLGIGVPTLHDILDQLIRPGRDPRSDLPLPILRSDVLKMEDLKPGMRLRGTVRNVVDFGVFVDIGVKQDGLLHRSQIPQGQFLAVGDIIMIEIIQVEIDRGRISLGWTNSVNIL